MCVEASGECHVHGGAAGEGYPCMGASGKWYMCGKYHGTVVAAAYGRMCAGAAGDGWLSVPLQATADGRPRVTLKYSDHSTQVINYRTLPAFAAHMDTFGEFQADTAFFTEEVRNIWHRVFNAFSLLSGKR